MIGFILGISMTLNICLILINMYMYKKIINNPMEQIKKLQETFTDEDKKRVLEYDKDFWG